MKHSEYSAVIIGSGSAGLYAALKIANNINLPDGLLLLTKSEISESNSRYAQGGIVGVMHQNIGDSNDLHVADTLKAGAGLSDEEVTRYISEISNDVISDLIDSGVDFDKDISGNLNYTLEAAHSFKRIMHVGGDATGKGIVEALISKVKSEPNITVIENSIAVELLVDSDSVCKGLIVFNELTGEHEIIYTPATVLATGGLGQIYKYTTNPECATGDGIDLAYNAGAIVQDMEFIQFHPTALALDNKAKNRFLISEAVRGEGAKLMDNSGNEFMAKYHDKRELAPRDIVTRAIYAEMKANKSPNMFLNAALIGSTNLLNRFPTISNKCSDNGIDITSMPIPVAPAAHYSMGGVKATVEGKTSLRGLYAIGEVASTGLHGANRLASNSLLECVACAYELADYLSFANLQTPKKIDDSILDTLKIYSSPLSDADFNIPYLKQELKNLMWDKVGIIRNADDLSFALDKVNKMRAEFKRTRKCLNREEYEYRNMLTVAELIIKSALERKESRGAHSRSDYAETSTVAIHSSLVKVKEEEFEYVK